MRITALFKKGTESRWSDEVHVVQSALTDGTTYRRNKVLLAPHNTVIPPTTEKKCNKSSHKETQGQTTLKRESIDASNILEGKLGTRAAQVLLKPERTTSLMTPRERKTEKV